ncbi:hypothetical protein GZH53_04210 [Flavihumibacter sp. R14]|nr:hypothetical protein [Flavihumibacter soli]
MRINYHTCGKVFSLVGAICLYLGVATLRASELPHIKHIDSVKVFRDTTNWFNTNLRSYSKKGKFFFNFGTNWSGYGKSDINLEGPGYNFTLKDVSGEDQPYKPSYQYNIHAGYYFSDRYSITFGYDHMKYVMDVPQQVIINGVIGTEVSNPVIPTGPYAGEYDNETVTVTPQLLTMEYTDGFNYVSTHVHRYDDIWVSDNGRTSLALETGLGVGAIIPRADVRLFTIGENNKLNFSGWAASIKAGLMFNFNKSVFFVASLEGGHSNMYEIHTTGRNNFDKASQKLNFLQNLYMLGVRF